MKVLTKKTKQFFDKVTNGTTLRLLKKNTKYILKVLRSKLAHEKKYQ